MIRVKFKLKPQLIQPGVYPGSGTVGVTTILESLPNAGNLKSTLNRDCFDGHRVDYFEKVKNEYLQFRTWKKNYEDRRSIGNAEEFPIDNAEDFTTLIGYDALLRKAGVCFYDPKIVEFSNTSINRYISAILSQMHMNCVHDEEHDHTLRKIEEYNLDLEKQRKEAFKNVTETEIEEFCKNSEIFRHNYDWFSENEKTKKFAEICTTSIAFDEETGKFGVQQCVCGCQYIFFRNVVYYTGRFYESKVCQRCFSNPPVGILVVDLDINDNFPQSIQEAIKKFHENHKPGYLEMTLYKSVILITPSDITECLKRLSFQRPGVMKFPKKYDDDDDNDFSEEEDDYEDSMIDDHEEQELMKKIKEYFESIHQM